ncbi:unnamed protein product, partial [Mesorhabditis belari]|uniref:Transmembrane protein 135 N-terminal domain-containing protein n=1 Tax=Mesorhabditis belari TaxID=2138241 RepID=A0AAF3F142_9BILA
MTVLSKFVAGTLGMKVLTTNCYETCHTWEPDCTKAIQAAVPEALLFSLRTYAIFYALGELVSTKGDPRKIRWKRLLAAISRSSLFLTTNLVMYLWYMCRIRNLMGFWTWPTLGLTNGLLSSFTAILIEKPARRPALALYLTNLASETAYRQAVSHGYLRFIPKGQWIVFSLGLGLYYWLKGEGRLEASGGGGLLEKIQGIDEHAVLPSWLWTKLPTKLREYLIELRKGDKGDECGHEFSCASAVVEPSLRNFVIGFGVSSCLTILRNLKTLKKQPLKILFTLLSKNNFRIPAFIALMPFLYNTMNCGLRRWIPGENWETTRKTVAGLVSGVAMRAFPNVTIAMYMLWKAISHLFEDLLSKGYLPKIPHGATLLYTLATGYVLFVAAIEPHSLRSGYYEFLMGLSGNRLGLLNRKLFDGVGFNSSKMFPHFFPILNHRFVTRNTMEYHPIPRV